jgi:ParB family chromosome partitioning protein
MGHARVLAGIKDTKRLKILRNTVINKFLSVRQLEALAKKKARAPRTGTKEKEADLYYRSLEDRLKQSLGTKVAIKKRGKRGHIVIHFYSSEELERLLDVLS